MAFYIGSTFENEYSFTDYDNTYTATLRLRGLAAATIDLTGTLTGGVWKFTADATVTATWNAGNYDAWIGFSLVDDNYTFKVADIEILIDPAGIAAGTDLRTDNEIALAAINLLLKGRTSDEAASISHEGRSLTKFNTSELIDLQKHYKKLVRTENGTQFKLYKART